MTFPRMLRLRQKFPRSATLNIPATIAAEFASNKLLAGIKPGARICVAAGSRGITNLAQIVGSVVTILKEAGAQPFIIPAMGSHGGATPEGQSGILADYGITEKTMGAPIRASMETKVVGTTADGIDVHCSTEAFASDGIVVINRVKPHTDFHGNAMASGVMKMIVIGLGKRNGAEATHAGAVRLGYERVMYAAAQLSLKTAPILCGVGIVEDPYHQTALIRAVPVEQIQSAETELLREARARMPKLPFDEVDLLIVDRIGKNISGAGMDTNIIGRAVQGYVSSLIPGEMKSPAIKRIFVRDVTPESHGNVVGVGLADFTTTRLVNAMNRSFTYINSITACALAPAKIPIYFDSDREVIERAIPTLALIKGQPPKFIRIADTLSLENVSVSEAYAAEIEII
jgi:hypothetical protein